jgi:hypothetical protein
MSIDSIVVLELAAPTMAGEKVEVPERGIALRG